MNQQTLVTFKSRAAADVTMLSDHAQALLTIVGKTLGERGVITADQIPGALSALKSAVGREKAAPGSEPESGESGDDAGDSRREPAVQLSQRAWPLMQMLERAGQDHADVLWGV
jgi:hypothetical protein